MRCWYPKWLRLCYFEGAFILQLDQICHAQFLLSISKTMVTKATSTMSFPSKAWHLVATSLAPPWVRWWKRTSCLTHPAQLRNWWEFPGHVENTWGPFKGLRLAARWVKVRFGFKKKRYFRWRDRQFNFRLGRLGAVLGWDSPKMATWRQQKSHKSGWLRNDTTQGSIFIWIWKELPRFPICPFRLLL